MVPAQVCMSFLKGFRIPAAPNEVDAVLHMHFLREDLADTVLLKNVADQLYRNQMPDAVRKCVQENVLSAQRQFEGFAAMRRPLEELIEELRCWITGEMEVAAATVAGPSVTQAPMPGKGETRNLQREAKIRSAVEHLVSPANIAKCRASGSTVTNCVWLPVNTGEGCTTLEDRPLRRAAWPASHFCGAPMLQKLKATETEVLHAAKASHAAGIPLQAGDDGACVEVLGGEDTEGQTVPYLISQVDPLPDASLLKLKCPAMVPE